MRGSISLESRPDRGTIASFSIPFNKPQFTGTSTPLVDLEAIPDRLQSELSLSCDNSSNFATNTSSPFHSPKHKPTASTNADKDPIALPSKPSMAIGAASSPYHILIVEDNAINQQIALKTIKSLGYTSSAVWNGQEALQYLLKATENITTPGAHKPVDHYVLPSLILMDVQMPILDGYRATHTLRHHAPFKSMTLLSRIPIVAVTASAIQGDREKCERAGMNDYLAKPVKRATLEKMIHKWVISEHRPVPTSAVMKIDDTDSARPDLSRNCTTGTTGTDDSSNCPGADYQIAEAQIDGNSHASQRVSIALSTLHSVGMSRVENASDKGLRLAEAAEIAATLRDAKLISAATEVDKLGAVNSTGSLGSTVHPNVIGSHMHEAYPDQHGPSLELTEENIEKLNADSADDSAATLQARSIPGAHLQEQVSDASALRIESLDAISIPVTDVSGVSATPHTSLPTRTSPAKSRRGQLSISDRKRSDWSNTSTVKLSQE
jgi:CheY-like chemotaxis protein